MYTYIKSCFLVVPGAGWLHPTPTLRNSLSALPGIGLQEGLGVSCLDFGGLGSSAPASPVRGRWRRSSTGDGRLRVGSAGMRLRDAGMWSRDAGISGMQESHGCGDVAQGMQLRDAGIRESRGYGDGAHGCRNFRDARMQFRDAGISGMWGCRDGAQGCGDVAQGCGNLRDVGISGMRLRDVGMRLRDAGISGMRLRDVEMQGWGSGMPGWGLGMCKGSHGAGRRGTGSVSASTESFLCFAKFAPVVALGFAGSSPLWSSWLFVCVGC